MAKLKELEKVNKLIISAKYACHNLQKEVNQKHYWYSGKPEYWKRSQQGQRWAKRLYATQKMINEIEQLKLVGFRFNIKQGNIIFLEE